MLVQATRTLSTLTLRALFYAALFGVVIIVQVALTTALRQLGLNGGVSLFVSGAVVLGLVLVLVNLADWLAEKRAAAREIARMRQGLPSGPCCVVWRGGEREGAAMPWDVVGGAVRARYPKLARRLGVEGVAVAEFEVSAEGAAKNVHCVYAWPSDIFFDAAREALAQAQFRAKPDATVRFGASYRMPFVFRISGAARLQQQSQSVTLLRPVLRAAREAVEKWRRSA